MRERRWETWALPAILALAALHFALQLGANDFYVDEALSVEHSVLGLHGLTHVVAHTETTPYTYFLGLHEWLGRVGHVSEASARLPSVVAGVLLVAATYWTALAFVARRTALGAALLCALSPFVLEYAQQARAYVFVMLMTTLAVGATVRGADATGGVTLRDVVAAARAGDWRGLADALRGDGGTRRDGRGRGPAALRGGRGLAASPADPRWLIAGGAAAVLALLLHYTATFAIAPLAVWVATRDGVDRRARVGFVAACVIADAALVPLFVDQYRAAPNGGELADAGLTGSSLARLASVPFDGRWLAGADWLRLIGVAATLAAIATVIARGRGIRHRGLLLAVGFTAPVALVLVGVLGKDVLITRYAAAGAPLVLIAIAAAVAALPRPAAAALAGLVAIGLAGGLVRSHVPKDGFYAPARSAIAYVHGAARPGDALIFPGDPGVDIPLAYYALRDTPRVTLADPADALDVFHRGGRVWVVRSTDAPAASPHQLLALADAGLKRLGYHAVQARAFDTSTTLSVILAVSDSRRP